MTEPVRPHSEGRARNSTVVSEFCWWGSCESGLHSAFIALILSGCKNSLQNLHLMASAWIISAQKGHFFVCS